MPTFELALAGLAVGVLVGLTGMGGGALLTPILVLLFGVDPSVAVGSDLVVALVMKPVGAAVHHRAGSVRWDLVRWLLPTAVPAAFCGAWLMGWLGGGPHFQATVRTMIGAVLLLGVIAMGAQAFIAARRGTPHQPGRINVRPIPTLFIGLAGGLIVGATSVGSGSLMIVGLLALYPALSARDLVGTDLVQAVPIVGAAALGHVLFGSVELTLTTGLLLGAIPGTYLGARLASRVSNRAVKQVLVVVLFASALQMLHVPTPYMLSASGLLVAGLLVAKSRRLRVRVRATVSGFGQPIVRASSGDSAP